MRRAILAAALALAASGARAAWYWPFGFDPDGTNKPPRLHRLLEKANGHIEAAEDEALNGNADAAVENYRLALRELERVELENPERAVTPEFAPLRNKRASCSAAIDAIRFAQVNDNERPVSVTNTRELEKRWRRKHDMLTPEDLEEERLEAERKRSAAKARGEKAPDAEAVARVAEELREGRFAEADELLEGLLEKAPANLGLLLMRAAAQAGAGNDYAARRTLEKAAKEHPESYLPAYNLARMELKFGDRAAARARYGEGRKAGGPRDEALERMFE